MYRLASFIRLQASGHAIGLIGILAGATSLFFLSTPVMAQGDLLVMPRRVIFETARKSQELNLANIGKDTARYTISIIDIRMNQDGMFETIQQPDSGQSFAGKYLRIFPRTVTLAPNESQVVKIQVTRSNELTTGEYRSHIYFRAVPAEKPLGEQEPANDTGISIHLVPVFGISIPVIIRIGETAAQVDLSDVSLKMLNDSIPRLTLALNRKGNVSVYGDLTVNFIAPLGKPIEVAAIKGIAVYTPTPTRRLQIDLNKIAGINYQSGRLQLVYSTSSDVKYARLAEAELRLN